MDHHECFWITMGHQVSRVRGFNDFHDIVKAPQGRLQNRAASEEVSSWHAVAARA